MRETMRKFLRSERGASAIEYALIAGLLSIVIVMLVGEIGSQVARLFESVRAAL